MTDSGPIPGQDVAQPQASPKMSAKRRAAKAKKEIQTRCAVAGLKCEDVVGLDSRPSFRVGLRCGRDLRWVYLEKNERIIEFPSIDFEKWVFLSEYNAICSYEGGVIEAQLRFLSPRRRPGWHSFDRRSRQSGAFPASLGTSVRSGLCLIPRMRVCPLSRSARRPK